MPYPSAASNSAHLHNFKYRTLMSHKLNILEPTIIQVKMFIHLAQDIFILIQNDSVGKFLTLLPKMLVLFHMMDSLLMTILGKT